LDVNAFGSGEIDGDALDDWGVVSVWLEADDDEPDELPLLHDATTKTAASRDR
jgi:hypothetical protein